MVGGSHWGAPREACTDTLVLSTAPSLHSLQSPYHRRSFNAHFPCACTDTPAERLIRLLGGLLEGRAPPLQAVASLMAALRSQQDMYTPDNLTDRIRKAAGMDVSARLACMLACTSSSPLMTCFMAADMCASCVCRRVTQLVCLTTRTCTRLTHGPVPSCPAQSETAALLMRALGPGAGDALGALGAGTVVGPAAAAAGQMAGLHGPGGPGADAFGSVQVSACMPVTCSSHGSCRHPRLGCVPEHMPSAMELVACANLFVPAPCKHRRR